MKRRVIGFTLIELMIAVAVIGILAIIVYPNYTEHVMSSRRADATGALMVLAGVMERHYTENGDYLGAAAAGANSGAPGNYASQSPVDGGTAAYNLTLAVSAATPTQYILTATPTGPQTGDKCGNLTLTQAGLKNVSSSTVDECWR